MIAVPPSNDVDIFAHARIADLRFVLDEEEVGAERKVGTAADAEAMYLADDRLLAVQEAHEPVHVAAHHRVVDHRVPWFRGVVVRKLDVGIQRRPRWRSRALAGDLGACGGDQIVTCAKPLSVAGEGDDVDAGIEVRLFDAGLQLARERKRDGVAPLRAVQRDARDAARHVVRHRFEGRHARASVRLAAPRSSSH